MHHNGIDFLYGDDHDIINTTRATAVGCILGAYDVLCGLESMLVHPEQPYAIKVKLCEIHDDIMTLQDIQ